MALVRRRYPSAALYRSRRKMIRHHQPTRLDSYVHQPRQRDRPTRPIPGRLSAGAENQAGRLSYIAIAALVGLVSIGVGLLITVLLVLLRHAI